MVSHKIVIASGLILGLLSQPAYAQKSRGSVSNIISHSAHKVKYDDAVLEAQSRIKKNFPPDRHAYLYGLLQKIEDSFMGKFLLVNKGLNGRMTQYIILYPKYSVNHPGVYPDGTRLAEFDTFVVERSPVFLASQERFTIFQEQLKKHIKPDSVLASIPCGLMDDLLTLQLPQNFSGHLVGIDADPLSIQEASDNAKLCKKANISEFYIRNGWDVDFPEKYDIITSNGLNIYVDTEENVIELYKNFHASLKPGGVLITSFLTPSPALSPESEWNLKEVNMEDAREQKEMFVDIIGVHWAHFYTSKQTLEHLKKAGFKTVELHWDRQKLFPTVVAYK